MRKILFQGLILLIFATLLSFCAHQQPIKRPVPTITEYKWDCSLQKPKLSDYLTYSDEFIDISFKIHSKKIAFELQNKTNKIIKINWDNIAFVSPEGNSKRVIHSGVRLINRNAPQAPSIIPSSSKLSDILIPSEHIEYLSLIRMWNRLYLFPNAQDKTTYKGKKFSVYMPIYINGDMKEYNFVFKINEVVKVKTPLY